MDFVIAETVLPLTWVGAAIIYIYLTKLSFISNIAVTVKTISLQIDTGPIMTIDILTFIVLNLTVHSLKPKGLGLVGCG